MDLAPPTRKLLVVDDESGILDGYRRILNFTSQRSNIITSSRKTSSAPALAHVPESQTIEVVCCSNGLDAIKAIEEAVRNQSPFAGGFFDVRLGKGIDGLETIRRAKDLDPDFLCVVVTAYQDRSIEEISRIFGDDFDDRWDFLTKPFTRDEILQKARYLISSSNRRRREKENLRQIEDQQEQLVRAERLAAVGTLARGIGHEFGNILLRIMGKAELALQDKDPKKMVGALEVISTATERAGVIVRNLQSLVCMEVQRELVNPIEPLRDSIQLVNHELHKSKIKVVEEFSENIPSFLLNKIEIGQVYLNLLINAIHAMEPVGGDLRIKVGADREGVRIEFIDTGCGIPPEFLNKIFEPLFTTKGSRGSGIGLSVSKKIVENHNGRLLVSSEPGKGSTFTVWFPNIRN